MYNFLVYICKNHSTTYKLIIIFLFHSVKQINYSYWKTCESSRLVKYTYNIDQISSTTEFQSTASSQKATGISYRQYAYRFKFQSTSSSQKATQKRIQQSFINIDFNPQLPRRKRRTAEARSLCITGNFNPQLPRRKRRHQKKDRSRQSNFNPQLPRRKRL